jgi:aspartyl-tRNA(Asn)/glutamyl-tRNA(Gln) amidotransferase subunit A
MTTDVGGSARMLQVLAGHDVNDSTCSRLPVGNYEAACGKDIRGLKIGVPQEYFAAGVDTEVQAAVSRVLDTLRAQGAEIVNVQLPHTEYGISTYYLIATAEASSNLSRFDGLRFGLRVQQSNDLVQTYEQSRGSGFGPEVKRRIMLGTYALSAGYYDAYYQKAQRVRTLIRNDFAAAFRQADVLITPVSPTPAFKIGEKVDDPLKMYLADIFSVPPSLAGIAGLSVPAGFATSPSGSRLPIGVQMLAPPFAEERLFQVAAAWERESPVKDSAPPELGSR